MATNRLVPVINAKPVQKDISGTTSGEVSTEKLEPSLERSETAANCVRPEPLVLSTLPYMTDSTVGKLAILPLLPPMLV